MSRATTPPTSKRPQQGGALMLAIFLAALAAMTILLGRLSAVSLFAEQQGKAAGSLAEAKNALLGYVRTNDNDALGLLPSPDMGKRDSTTHNEGVAGDSFGDDPSRGLLPNTPPHPDTRQTLLIGRLPFKTLGLPAARNSNGKCLWYGISAAFKSSNKYGDYVPSFNWDTLGNFELADSSNPHKSRAAALLFAPGTPGLDQSRRPTGLDAVAECGGNYVAGQYLENLSGPAWTALTDGNQAVFPLAAATPSPAIPPSAAISIATTASTDAATDHAIGISVDEVFDQILPTGKVQKTINDLLPLLKTCLENQNLATTLLEDSDIPGPKPDKISSPGTGNSRYVGPLVSTLDCPNITGSNSDELARWRDNFWLLVCDSPSPKCINLNGPEQCDGLLAFSGRRTATQQRATEAQKKERAQYFEPEPAPPPPPPPSPALLDAFQNADKIDVTARTNLSAKIDELSQDVALCLKRDNAGKVELDDFVDTTPNVGGATLVKRDIVADTLTLGNPNLPTGSIPGQAVGCTFSGDSLAFGSGVRFYFRFNIARVGDGFTFALFDAERNLDAANAPTAKVCGGAGSSGQYLGYAGRDLDTAGQLVAPPIQFPKIGLEFDTANNRFGATNVGDTTNNHLALVYWGRSHDWPAPQPVSPFDDDNTHGIPPQPLPANYGYPDPFAASACGAAQCVNLRTANVIDRDFHVRFEIVRTYDSASKRARYVNKVWVRRFDQMIPGMDNVGLDFSAVSRFAPNHAQTVDIDDLTADAEAFRRFRFGFTNAQSTRRQDITVRDIKASLR